MELLVVAIKFQVLTLFVTIDKTFQLPLLQRALVAGQPVTSHCRRNDMDSRSESYGQAGPDTHSKTLADWEYKIPILDFIFLPDMSQLWDVIVQNVKSNFGLMLIIAAQVFFAIINLLVKKLHAMDPPVGTLEVRLSVFFIPTD